MYIMLFALLLESNKRLALQKISNGQLATDGFDCTCTDADTYAYVYPDEFGTIYLFVFSICLL